MAEEQPEHKETEKKQPAAATGRNNHAGWAEIIKVVNSPLAYFAVPSLCFESLTVAALFSSLTEAHRFAAFIIGQGCILLGLVIVAVMTARYPRHLNADMAKALEKAEEFEEYVESKVFRDVVLNIVEERLKQLPPKAENEDKDEK